MNLELRISYIKSNPLGNTQVKSCRNFTQNANQIKKDKQAKQTKPIVSSLRGSDRYNKRKRVFGITWYI